MSGRTAAALCLAAFFFTTAWEWRWDGIATTWNALAAAVEAPASDPDEETEVETDGGEEGWLIDPNG